MRRPSLRHDTLATAVALRAGPGAGAGGSAPESSACTPGWQGVLGPAGVYGLVRAVTVFDDGSGPALYAGVEAAGSGGILRWDGADWSAVGDGLGEPAEVHALQVYDDGSGLALYAAGNFAGGGFARWDGASWTALPGASSADTIRTLTVYDDAWQPASKVKVVSVN